MSGISAFIDTAADCICMSFVGFSSCQSQLPATGAPVSGQRVDRMKAAFDELLRERTLSNWKYWVVSFVTQQ